MRLIAELALAFNVSTFALALPVYVHIQSPPGNEAILRLLFVTQIAPTVLIWLGGLAVRRYLRHQRFWWFYWGGLSLVSILSVVRLVQRELLGQLFLVPSLEKTVIAATSAIGLASILFVRRKKLPTDLAQFALVSLFLTVYFLATSGLTLAALDAGRVPPARSDSVYIFIFDELGRDVLLEDGRIDRARFPRLAELAASGVWFPNATSNYAETVKSIPSALTGQFRSDNWPPDEPIENLRPNLLLELARHYSVTVYSEFFPPCQAPSVFICRGVGYFAATRPELPLSQHWIPDVLRRGPLSQMPGRTFSPYTGAMFAELLRDLGRGAHGRAFYVHLILPHFPYVLDETGRLHDSPHRYHTGLPEEDVHAYRNYELQVRLVDRMIGEFVDTLEREGLFEEATVLITGDHGPRVTHPTDGRTFSVLTPNVPVILKSPSLAPGQSEVDWQLVDLAATLRDVLDLPSVPTDGVSAFSAERPLRQKVFSVNDEEYAFDASLNAWVRMK